jgi:hypothetical protein
MAMILGRLHLEVIKECKKKQAVSYSKPEFDVKLGF